MSQLVKTEEYHEAVGAALAKTRRRYADIREKMKPDSDTRMVNAWKHILDLAEELSEAIGQPRSVQRRDKPPPRHFFVVQHELQKAVKDVKNMKRH